MSRGLILVAALVGVVVLAAGWRAAADDTGAAPGREEAAAQEIRQADPEPEAPPADDVPSASDSKDPAPGSSAPQSTAVVAETKRLAVDNVLQVGGFGCVSCATVIEGTLQEADGVRSVAYEPETDTYVVEVNDDFRVDEVAERIRSISKDYNRRLGLPNQPDWVLKEV
ncbi:MAG: cation transporter [Actinomycetota bacterium]|nr:cation transporter [Actinomycetota bacterium]